MITRAFVERVIFDGKRAVGVDYQHVFGGTKRVNAGHVVLCGGAINSPQLLQLSGVGNAADLQALGIDVVHDLPGVGENLQDHLEVYIQYACKQPVTMQKYLKWRYRPWIGANWLFLRRGPGATNHFEGGGFVRSNDDVAYPNLMFHFLPIAVRYDGSSPEGGEGYQVHVGPMYSDARGSVKITSRDPKVHPALRFNYLSTDQDRREWIESIRVARGILNQPAMAPFNGGEVSPGPSVDTDEEILEWVARDAETALHPSCTAKMGTDPMAVTDPQTMGVHGIEGLSVVDASVMPYVTNGNIYAPVMMVAEKAADLILGNQPLPPATVSVLPAPAQAAAAKRSGTGRPQLIWQLSRRCPVGSSAAAHLPAQLPPPSWQLSCRRPVGSSAAAAHLAAQLPPPIWQLSCRGRSSPRGAAPRRRSWCRRRARCAQPSAPAG